MGESVELKNYCMCTSIGVAAMAQPFLKEHEDGTWEMRVWVAIMGGVNPCPPGMEYVEDPFHEDFFDNYCSGKGNTKGEAEKALAEDMKSMARTLI